jgi:hypothetical protein
VYSYDLSDDGLRIGNKRPVYLSQDWVPDGLKVAGNGFVGEFLNLSKGNFFLERKGECEGEEG